MPATCLRFNLPTNIGTSTTELDNMALKVKKMEIARAGLTLILYAFLPKSFNRTKKAWRAAYFAYYMMESERPT